MENVKHKIRAVLFVLVTAVFASIVFHYFNPETKKLLSSTPLDRQTASAPANSPKPDLGIYLSKIQPIFDGRCIACHSCYNSPCQLDLTSYEGLTRGANKRNLYTFPKTKEALPTRLGIDAKTPEEWHQKEFGFFSVLSPAQGESSNDLTTSTLFKMIDMRYKTFAPPQSEDPDKYKRWGLYQSEDSRYCPNSSVSGELRTYSEARFLGGMPYGFPALKNDELNEIRRWLQASAPPPSAEIQKIISDPGEYQHLVTATENFLNGNDFKSHLVARYIYEHLFLAHIYFDDSENRQGRPKAFFRLIRAENQNNSPVEIPTVRPMNNPHKPFFYRFKKYTNSIVHKNHLPYKITSKKLGKWNREFIKAPWTKHGKVLSESDLSSETPPAYGRDGVNPFETFALVPVKARAQFLLDDAHYHTMAFIKGPVCNGQVATGVIDDNFWVMYMNPAKDISVLDPEFFAKNAKNLELPVVTDIRDLRAVTLSKVRKNHLLVNEDKYSRYKARYPQGLDLEAIWDGDGDNSSALLTIYRHNTSATVLKGAHGQTPKTVWVLDYPLFEDIYYNLVAEYNVFGPLPHQIATRRYMDHSRIDGQDLFINFLPVQERENIRNQWSDDPPNGSDTGDEVERRMEERFPNLGRDVPTAITYRNGDPKSDFLNQIFTKRLKPEVRGPRDTINSGTEGQMTRAEKGDGFSALEAELRKIAGRPGLKLEFLPDASYIRVEKQNGAAKLYTMIHNREHYNVNFVFGEKKSLRPEMDSINFVPGIAASYPNMYFHLSEADVPRFVSQISSLDGTPQTWRAILQKFAVLRSSEKFWDFNDWVTKQSIALDPVEGAPLDLSRYATDIH